MDYMHDVIRKEIESCDGLQGFQMTHSLCGGTGSGFCSALLERLREFYCEKQVMTFSVFPSMKVSDTFVEPYNAILSIPELIEHTDSVVSLDNKALYNICSKTLKLANPSYGDLNHLITTSMSNITCSFRLPCQTNCDMKKFHCNLIPFPRLHFFITGLAPLTSRGSQ